MLAIAMHAGDPTGREEILRCNPCFFLSMSALVVRALKLQTWAGWQTLHSLFQIHDLLKHHPPTLLRFWQLLNANHVSLGAGIARVKEMTDAGVNVGLGVDGSASNDTGHMLHEVRLAMFLQRAGGDPLGTVHCTCAPAQI